METIYIPFNNKSPAEAFSNLVAQHICFHKVACVHGKMNEKTQCLGMPIIDRGRKTFNNGEFKNVNIYRYKMSANAINYTTWNSRM